MFPAPIGGNDPLPSVSVIVPAFNCEHWIRPCLDSILASDYPRDLFEVVCVDNASTDGTPEILRKFSHSINVIRETKRGASAARNAGLRAASGPMVAFTDADCVVDRKWLRHIVEPVWKGRAAAVGGRILARPEAGPVERFGEIIHDHARAITCTCPPYLITMNLAVELALLRSIGCFDERWLRKQDVDLSYRILATGGRFAYAPDAVIYHHNRDTLPALAREGFRHGHYHPQFRKHHQEFIRDYRKRHYRDSRCAPPDTPPAAERLKRWQIGLYQAVFKAGKRTGKIKGRWFPPKLG